MEGKGMLTIPSQERSAKALSAGASIRTHTCSSVPSAAHDFMMRPAFERPILSLGATGPLESVDTADCSRL
eukprot:6194262-Prymnesium_polylepis.1